MHHCTSTKIQKKYYEHHHYIIFYRAESQKLYKHCRVTSNFAQNYIPEKHLAASEISKSTTRATKANNGTAKMALNFIRT